MRPSSTRPAAASMDADLQRPSAYSRVRRRTDAAPRYRLVPDRRTGELDQSMARVRQAVQTA
jgi:hypothetical protein